MKNQKKYKVFHTKFLATLSASILLLSVVGAAHAESKYTDDQVRELIRENNLGNASPQELGKFCEENGIDTQQLGRAFYMYEGEGGADSYSHTGVVIASPETPSPDDGDGQDSGQDSNDGSGSLWKIM